MEGLNVTVDGVPCNITGHTTAGGGGVVGGVGTTSEVVFMPPATTREAIYQTVTVHNPGGGFDSADDLFRTNDCPVAGA